LVSLRKEKSGGEELIILVRAQFLMEFGKMMKKLKEL
jgi:hypothetical protein